MEIRNVISFIKVAELNSFSKAAAELGYTQSNVTTQIKQLENELNTILFDRIGRSVSLTSAGKTFMKYALQITAAVTNARQELSYSAIPSGELRVGLLESLCITYLPQIIKRYHEKYPLVNTIIKIGTYGELTTMLNSNTIDLLWTFDTHINSDLWIKELEYANPICVIAPKSHSLCNKHTLHLSDLSSETFIFTESSCSYRHTFEELLLSKKLPFHTFMEIGNTEIIKKFVVSGICLSILPQFSITNELQAQLLHPLNIIDFQLDMYGQVFYHKNKCVTPAMKAFIDLVKEHI